MVAGKSFDGRCFSGVLSTRVALCVVEFYGKLLTVDV